MVDTTLNIGIGRENPSRYRTSIAKSSRGRNACPTETADQFPANLLDAAAADAETSEDEWWLGHVRPRQEKSVAAALMARGVGYYLPMLTRKTVSRGRTRVAHIPLFPGYVFLRGTKNDRLTALRTNRLLTVQPVPDGGSLRSQLAQFAELIAAGAPLTRESRLVAGERVRIKAGPFRNIEGTVLRRSGKTELLVAIDFLHQGASLEIDDLLLEPV